MSDMKKFVLSWQGRTVAFIIGERAFVKEYERGKLVKSEWMDVDCARNMWASLREKGYTRVRQ